MNDRYDLDDEQRCQPLYDQPPNRRDFLRSAGGLVVLCTVGRAAAQRGDGERDPAREVLASWLHVDEDGAVTAYSGKVDVGQNVRTTLAQVVAEELRVPAEQVRMVLGDTTRCPYDAGTFGSQTTPRMVPILRRAAAFARELLVGLAAEQWAVDRTALRVRDGRVVHPASGRAVSYGELTRGRKLLETIAEAPETPPGEWRVAGQSLPKANGPAIVTGRHRFPSDQVRPGMLIGKVLRPPAHGSRLRSVDTSAAEAVPGAVVVRDGDFVGVAAPNEWTAERALAAIRAEWTTTPQPSDRELWPLLRPERVLTLAGEPAEVKLDATYTVAYIAHVPLEPRAALAEWTDGALHVWCGTQRPFGVREELCRAFGLPPERVRVEVPDTGSGYGGKHTGEAAIEAARLARGVGRPVRLVWTRAEEFQWAYFRPAGVIDVAAGCGRDGRLAYWEMHNWNSGPAALDTAYDVPRKKVEFHRAESPLRQGSYRGLAGCANFFARETAMDELAEAAGIEPLEFRLRNAGNPRLAGVLRAAAERFGWGGAAPTGHGYGLAAGFEKGSYVATCAEVAVADGRAAIVRVVTAFDCGRLINPDTVRNQIEGMQVMGLGGALFEAIEFADGVITNGSLSRYRVPRFADVPAIETIMVETAGVGSAGAGETPMMALAPAVGNAIKVATGVRLRGLPLRLS